MIKYITDKTMIPVGIAVVAIGGGSMWLTNVQARLSSHDDHFMRIETTQLESRKDIREIRDSLFEIKGELKELLKKSENRR